MEIVPCNASLWKNVLARLESHSFFATYTWAQMLAAGLGYTSQGFVLRSENFQVLMPLMRRTRFGFYELRSMPYGTYGGALIAGECLPREQQAAAQECIQYLRRDPRFLHLWCVPGPYPHLPLPGFEFSFETHKIDLGQGVDLIWKQFDPDARNQVRQAERAQVEVSFDNSPAAFDAYYDMLLATAQRWGKKSPGKPRTLFHSIAQYASEDSTRLWLAQVNGELAAGALCFYGKGEVFYWSGAMNQDLARARPNNLLQWVILQDAVARGYRVYNMGASDGLPGVRKFKEGFGAKPVKYPAYLVSAHLAQPLYAFMVARRKRAE